MAGALVLAANPREKNNAIMEEQGEQEDSLLIDSDDSLEFEPNQRHRSSGRVFALLAAGLGLVASGGAVAFWPKPSVQLKPSEVPRKAPQKDADERFLASDELARTVVEHAIRFHNEADSSFLQDLSHEELRKLKDELLPKAAAQSLTMAKKIEAKDKDAARKLSELKLTDEQWRQTHHLMDALHDTRVQDLGQYVAHAVQQSAGDQHSVANKLSERHEELRQLASEVIPSSVQDLPQPSQTHWQMAVDAQGRLEAHGALGGWDASVEMQERRLEESTKCALSDTWYAGSDTQMLLSNYAACLKKKCEDQENTTIFGKNRNTCQEVLTTFGQHCDAEFNTTITVEDACPVTCGKCTPGRNRARTLWITIASTVAAVLSVATLLLTLTLGPSAAVIMYIIQASLGGLLCGTSVGLAFIPALRNIATWVPCFIMTTFTGLESIWSVRLA